MNEVLAWQGFAILFAWVPFALTAFVVDHWHRPVVRRHRLHAHTPPPRFAHQH